MLADERTARQRSLCRGSSPHTCTSDWSKGTFRCCLCAEPCLVERYRLRTRTEIFVSMTSSPRKSGLMERLCSCINVSPRKSSLPRCTHALIAAVSLDMRPARHSSAGRNSLSTNLSPVTPRPSYSPLCLIPLDGVPQALPLHLRLRRLMSSTRSHRHNPKCR